MDGPISTAVTASLTTGDVFSFQSFIMILSLVNH